MNEQELAKVEKLLEFVFDGDTLEVQIKYNSPIVALLPKEESFDDRIDKAKA